MTSSPADPGILKARYDALRIEIADAFLDPVSSPLRDNPEFVQLIELHAQSLRCQARLLKQDATLAAILEELQQAEARMLAASQQLDQERKILHSFAPELGKAAYAGFKAGELDDYPVFADRQELQWELESLYREQAELLAKQPEGTVEKIKKVTEKARFAQRIQTEEAKIGPAEESLGKAIMQADERWSFECGHTKALLPKIKHQQKKIDVARNQLAQAEEALDNVKSAATLKLGRPEVEDVEIKSEKLKLELKQLHRQYSRTQKEITANRRIVHERFLKGESLGEQPALQQKLQELAELKVQLQQSQPGWKGLISQWQSWMADLSPEKKQMALGFSSAVLCMFLLGYAIRSILGPATNPLQITQDEELDLTRPSAVASAELPQSVVNSLGMKLILIPRGTFIIGSPPDEAERFSDEKQKPVTVGEDYYLAAFQVTQAQYRQVMGINPSYFQGPEYGDTSNHPVEHVSWKDAVEFCWRLSELPEEKRAGRIYRLPTEAEWEYACRAGSTTAYSFGDDSRQLVDYAWFGNNSGRKRLNADMLWDLLSEEPESYRATMLAEGCQTHPVGLKQPNAWGLYDMHGNVWEWCLSWLEDYSTGLGRDFGDQTSGSSFRVLRGGNWDFWAAGCRSASRFGSDPADNSDFYGFRVVLSTSKAASFADKNNQEAKQASGITVDNSIGMKLVLIPQGSFTMGSPLAEQERTEQEDQIQVTLSRDYFLGAFEVTQSQYQRVMGKNPSSFQGVNFGDTSNHPVETVSWQDAVEFCRRLSDLPEEREAGRSYRLPTEAEWEYACRAGSRTAYCFGESSRLLAGYGWFSGNSARRTHPVGEKKPNDWGLYDMHGNVFEWCWDWSGQYPILATTDPVGPRAGTERIRRGGCWCDSAAANRSAFRDFGNPARPSFDTGFRVVMTLEEPNLTVAEPN
jgi:formylglycine-generating enzyme required for sulfatase activity